MTNATIDYSHEKGGIAVTWEAIEHEFGPVWDESSNYDDQHDSEIIQRLLNSGAPTWVEYADCIFGNTGWWIKEPKGATTINHSTNPFGDVEFNGVTVHLTQEAFFAAEGDHVEPFYRAKGVDDDGDTYTVTWKMKGEFWRYDDNGKIVIEFDGPEDKACDWHDYTVTPDDPSLWR
jgi:hypothetical protein